MKKNIVFIVTLLLFIVTTNVAQNHTNYVTAIGTNGYSLTLSITAPADDTQQPMFDPVPQGWTINGTLNIPGGDFVNFTENDLNGIIFIYTGANFSNPGDYLDVNFFEFEATSNLGDLYSGEGVEEFLFSVATGAWEDNFGGKSISGGKKYTPATSKAVVDDLVISESPAPPAPAVPLSPWAIVIAFSLITFVIIYRIKRKAIV